MKVGNIILKRADSVFKGIPEVEDYFEMMSGFNPSFKELSNNTYLLRIPSFNISFKKKIDSLLKVNHNKIINTKNLIVDIRNNGGGSDAVYRSIIPYLYTNPIREVAVEFLSTPLNNARMDKIINNPDYPEDTKEWAKIGLEKLINNPNQFVKLGDEEIEIQTEEQVYANPKNVAIIINENNGSTSEQFLLAAKQSKKVKLFGVTTVGVLDISNMNFVTSPCGDLTLGYCLSKSLRIPDMAIDAKGIQPDYYIDKSIPDYKWIDFVEKTLNK
jgi:C-terminal processing protease CtpA/Prc